MMPHHLKLLLAALAFPLAILLGISLYQGYMTYIRTPTVEPANRTRIQFPNYHLVALDAVAKFNALPPSKQNLIRKSLGQNLADFKPWLEAFKAQNYEIICLGENHNNRTRLFLTQTFFAHFQPDILMLEATEADLAHMKKSQRSYISLLNADISSVLKAQAPATKVVGIEQSEQQKSNVTPDQDSSRDRAILANFLTHFQPQKSNLVLFGALHCGDFKGWFYDLLRHSKALAAAPKMTNLRVLGEHQDGSLEAFIYFLDEIGLKKTNFTITRPHALEPWLHKAFAVFNDQTLKHYEAVIVFREN